MTHPRNEARNADGLAWQPPRPGPETRTPNVTFAPRRASPGVGGRGAGGSCAWGSWKSAQNPTLRDVHEYVIVASKEMFGRARKGESTIGRDEFMDATISIWSMGTASAKRIGHPAPFPVELPRRLIELYTFTGDLVLDPFMGSGSTAIAAKHSGRHYVGYDTSREYIELARQRIKSEG